MSVFVHLRVLCSNRGHRILHRHKQCILHLDILQKHLRNFLDPLDNGILEKNELASINRIPARERRGYFCKIILQLLWQNYPFTCCGNKLFVV